MSMEWLKSFWRKKKVIDPTDTPVDAPTVVIPIKHAKDFAAVILVAPRYDQLTTAMEIWMRELEKELHASGANVIPIYGNRATGAELGQVLTEIGNSEVLLVFYGHGVDEAFCTVRSPGSPVVVDGVEHGRLCGFEEFDKTARLAIAAFCCHAAKDLGRALRRRATPARFLGFTDYLDFVFEPSAQVAFARPMARIVSETVALGELTRDAWRRLHEEYTAVSAEWTSGSMAGSDRSLLVAMFLDEHRDFIDPTV